MLMLALRGIPGNPTSEVINKPAWSENGPFELSPERGRFALTLSLVEDKSFYFSLPIARFATPDLGYKNGHYVSLFAPGISFLIIPGYLIGEIFSIGQVGSFAVISLFALLNALLIRAIAIRLKAHPVAASIAALVFLFATPAFAYAVSLYQHHISTFLILSSIYLLLRWKSLWSLSLIWLLIAASIPVDYPNFFLMLPIGIFALGKLTAVKRTAGSTIFNIKIAGILTFATIIFPLSFFLWVNQMSYGNPLQLSGTVAGVRAIDQYGKPTAPTGASQDLVDRFIHPETQNKSAIGFFETRSMLNGFYIHFISPDRGIIWFTPIMLFSSFGAYYLYKKSQLILVLLSAIIGANILLYSMWSDPWGGWAFGSRYLIPGYAIMAILISLSLTHFRKNLIFLIFFSLVMSYSIFVNEAGAITSSKNPPQVEILNLEKLSGHEEKYTFHRNIEYLLHNQSKSFAWQTWGKNFVSAIQYFEILYTILIIVSWSMIIKLKAEGGENA